MVKNGSKMVKNGQKWSKMTKNGQKCQKCPKNDQKMTQNWSKMVKFLSFLEVLANLEKRDCSIGMKIRDFWSKKVVLKMTRFRKNTIFQKVTGRACSFFVILAFPGYCTSKNDQKSCMFYRSFFHIFFQK
jgi:hypothetical protein